MKTIEEITAAAEQKVLADLNEKHLGNQPKPANEPTSLIKQALADSTQHINPKNGTIE